jgi:hypothetical protein
MIQTLFVAGVLKWMKKRRKKEEEKFNAVTSAL